MLSDVLLLLRERPELTAFIVLGQAHLTRFGHDQVVAGVCGALGPVCSRCVLVSPDLSAIFRARRIARCATGWILPAYDPHTRLKCEALQPQYLFCHHSLLPAAGALWRGPWRWVIHDVTSLELALQLAERGAGFIATRHVAEMSDAMRAYAVAKDRDRAADAGEEPPPDLCPASLDGRDLGDVEE